MDGCRLVILRSDGFCRRARVEIHWVEGASIEACGKAVTDGILRT